MGLEGARRLGFQIDNKLAKLPRNAKPDWHTKLKEQAKQEWSEGQLTYE
jgi:hypothetical protein